MFYCATVSWDISHVDLFFYFDFLIVPSNAIYGVSRDRGNSPCAGGPLSNFSRCAELKWESNGTTPRCPLYQEEGQNGELGMCPPIHLWSFLTTYYLNCYNRIIPPIHKLLIQIPFYYLVNSIILFSIFYDLIKMVK